MRTHLLLSTTTLLACSTLSHPIRASSLGAPTTIGAGEREFIAGSGFIGKGESLNADQNVEIGSTGMLAGTLRQGLSDRLSLDVGGELVLHQFWRPSYASVVGGLRYTTDPKPLQRRAVWADLELGVGANVLLYEISLLLPGMGVYAGAGVAARFDKVTTFGRYRFQLVEGEQQATADYHSLHVGVQGAITPSVDLYAATGLATAGGRADLEREKYEIHGPFPVHIDLGVRFRLPDRSTRGGLPRTRPPRARLCPCPPDDGPAPADEAEER